MYVIMAKKSGAFFTGKLRSIEQTWDLNESNAIVFADKRSALVFAENFFFGKEDRDDLLICEKKDINVFRVEPKTIRCNKCNGELSKQEASTMFLTDPPKYYCSACTWQHMQAIKHTIC